QRAEDARVLLEPSPGAEPLRVEHVPPVPVLVAAGADENARHPAGTVAMGGRWTGVDVSGREHCPRPGAGACLPPPGPGSTLCGAVGEAERMGWAARIGWGFLGIGVAGCGEGVGAGPVRPGPPPVSIADRCTVEGVRIEVEEGVLGGFSGESPCAYSGR